MKKVIAVVLLLTPMLYGRANAVPSSTVEHLRKPSIQLACSAWSYVCYNWTYGPGANKSCNYGRWECTRR